MADEILLTIPRPGGEELRLSLAEFRGSTFLNLRTWFNAGGGEMRPTQKGCTFPLWAIPDLRAALEQAEAIARRDGHLEEAPRATPRH